MINYFITTMLETNSYLMRGQQNRYNKTFKPYEASRMSLPLESGGTLAFSIKANVSAEFIETMKTVGEALERHMQKQSQNIMP